MAGGQLGELHNGTQYREVRQFCSGSGHHLVRFYFLTRVYSEYLEDVLEELSYGPAPDLVIINSCLWDLSRFRLRGKGNTGWRWRYGAIPVPLPTLCVTQQIWPLPNEELQRELGTSVCTNGSGFARLLSIGVEHGNAFGGACHWGFSPARGE